jgi:hypothetical protein
VKLLHFRTSLWDIILYYHKKSWSVYLCDSAHPYSISYHLWNRASENFSKLIWDLHSGEAKSLHCSLSCVAGQVHRIIKVNFYNIYKIRKNSKNKENIWGRYDLDFGRLENKLNEYIFIENHPKIIDFITIILNTISSFFMRK